LAVKASKLQVGFAFMFDDQSDPNVHLYHYTTRASALGNILPLSQLRLSPLSWTNDPREFQPWLFDFIGQPPIGEGSSLSDDLQVIDDRIRITTKVACLTRNDPELRAYDWEDHARGWAHSRMWDQYAEGHRGVCLVFDHEMLAEKMQAALTDGVLWDNPVHYQNNVLIGAHLAHEISYPDIERLGVDELAELHVEKYWQYLFFLKARDWESEWEYRWVYRDGQPGPAFIDTDNALKGVMIGSRFPESDLPLLQHFGDNLGLALARCSWRNGYPGAERLG